MTPKIQAFSTNRKTSWLITETLEQELLFFRVKRYDGERLGILMMVVPGAVEQMTGQDSCFAFVLVK